MASKVKEVQIGKVERSIPLEALSKDVKGVAFGHAKRESVDEKAFKAFLDRLQKQPDIGARMKGASSAMPQILHAWTSATGTAPAVGPEASLRARRRHPVQRDPQCLGQSA